MKYLPLYYEWMEIGWFPFLCHRFTRYNNPYFSLFRPTWEELDQHEQDGYLRGAWGVKVKDSAGEPTAFRQNIVLFMAAMNGEL